MITRARKEVLAPLFFLLIFPRAVTAACREENLASRFTSRAYAAELDAAISYLGHNFFQIITGKGTRIVTDPLGPGWYPDPNVSADVVTVGREHINHNYVELVRGNPIILRGLRGFGAEWNRVSMNVKDVFIYNVPIYQNGRDESSLKGAAFVFDLGDLCIAHLGDLSHPLTSKQLTQFGKIDVALTPIGGRYTMGPDTAQEVVRQLKPKIAIPMHYRQNPFLLEEFVKGFKAQHLSASALSLSRFSLPKSTEIIVLTPKGGREYQ